MSTRNDTAQQTAILRQSRSARAVRAKYPVGTRVRHTGGDQEGTVKRHIPGSDAQGGSLIVEWDNGITGRLQPISAELAPADSDLPAKD